MPKKTAFAAALLWTFAITVLSLISLNNVTAFQSIASKDKYVHFIFYLVFTFLWGLTFVCNKYKKGMLLFFAAVAYGGLMEIAQGLFTVNRHPDLYDVIANSCGAFAGLLAVFYYFNRYKVEAK